MTSRQVTWGAALVAMTTRVLARPAMCHARGKGLHSSCICAHHHQPVHVERSAFHLQPSFQLWGRERFDRSVHAAWAVRQHAQLCLALSISVDRCQVDGTRYSIRPAAPLQVRNENVESDRLAADATKR